MRGVPGRLHSSASPLNFKTMRIHIIIIFLFTLGGMLFTSSLPAQDQALKNKSVKHIDVVYLKNGSEFRGQIIEYVPGSHLSMKILGGPELTFEDSKIDRIVQEVLNQKVRNRDYNFKEEGFYNFTSISNFNSRSNFGDIFVGFGAHTVSGYQINRLIGLGLGFGIDNYEVSFAKRVVPLYLEARGYLLKKNISPYYSMNMGWGFPLKQDNFGVNETAGGMYINPSIGVRFGGKKTSNFILDAGYKYQRASYISRFDDVNVTKDTYDFKRIVVRLGILF